MFWEQVQGEGSVVVHPEVNQTKLISFGKMKGDEV